MLGAPAGARRARRDADVLHLHHLTPINEAAERAFPDVPRVGHLHGTELLMLREIDEGPPAGLGPRRPSGPSGCGAGRALRAAARALAGRGAAGAGPAWGGRPSASCGRPTGSTRGLRPPARPEGSRARALAALARGGAARLGRVGRAGQRRLPRGRPRAVRQGGPVLLYVGRYTEVKRIPLLIRAHAARARALRCSPAPLVLLGGFPGRVGGRAPARGRARDRAIRTSSWPAGAGTRTCPTG